MLVKVDGVRCPKCNSDSHYAKSFAEKGVYFCQNELSPKVWCNETTCKCEKCNKIYPLEKFGLRGDVYECKICGTPQWALTEKKRSDAQLKKMTEQFDTKLSALYKKYGW